MMLVRAQIERRTQFLLTANIRSEEHTSELQSLMRISYAVFCLKKKIQCTQQCKKISYHNITFITTNIHRKKALPDLRNHLTHYKHKYIYHTSQHNIYRHNS